MILGLQGYKINSLYLVANRSISSNTLVLTTTSAVPLLCGLSERFDDFVDQGSFLAGSLFSIGSVMLYGYLHEGTWLAGMNRFFFQSYDWSAFLIAFLSSFIGMFIWYVLKLFVSGLFLNGRGRRNSFGSRKLMENE